MRTILPYVLVIPLSPLAMSIGMIFAGFPIALALAWTSVGLRTKVAGFLGGVGGVAIAVGFGFLIFTWIAGAESYTIGPFLATILPLFYPIVKDFAQAQRVNEAREQMLATFKESRPESVSAMSDFSKTAHASGALGELLGVALACFWFFNQ